MDPMSQFNSGEVVMPVIMWVWLAAMTVCLTLIASGIYVWYLRRLNAILKDSRDAAELAARKVILQAEIDQCLKWLEMNKQELLMKDAERQDQERVRSELVTLKEQLIREEEAVALAKREAQDLQHVVSALVEDKDHLGKQKEQLNQEIKAISDSLVEFKKQQSELAVKLKTLEEEIKQKEKELQALNANLDQLTANRKRTEQEAVELETKRRTLAMEVEMQTEKKKQLSEMVGELVKQMQTFERAAKPTMQDRLEDFDRNLLKLETRAQNPRQEVGEADALTRFEEVLKSAKYKFHPRLINAFHTGLKIADISPLVVLAGISGTGKSQLPRLYAEFMGMHFLNVAVQPRWDGPQDLFGFYNYMEHRYKATELARALRQMDKYNWQAKNDSDRKIQEGMLLVLLDEMNLARVEYYFSELLSRLEMRPRRNDPDESRRRSAEIEIEAGSLDSTQQARRLFVAHNVLFVGTMNEDETTQSLSDKVVDRANVIRFGKPETKPDSIKAFAGYSEGYLKHSAWENWLADKLDDRDRAERLETVCKELNAALEKLGRPFGFRTHQAIYKYVANYPKRETNWFDHAVADQIEQKILPKLRGISKGENDDSDQALDDIKGIIDERKDVALAEAFEKALNRPIFQFAGVNR